jgi:drug/metabolite transporter (DMT)-like permease
LSVSGKLEIAAVQDLGGLGRAEGARVPYTWAHASIFPLLLPWLGVSLLLLIKRNRAPGAWWVWVAVLCGFALQPLLRVVLPLPSSSEREVVVQTLTALNFGMAAAWLLSGFLARKHRFLSFLALFGIIFGVATAAYLSQLWGDERGEAMVGGIAVALCAFIISGAISLVGLIARKRYGPVRLVVWSAVMVAGLCLLVLAPFFVFAVLSNPGIQDITKGFATALLVLFGMNLGTLLVYLVLAFATNFYRLRLKGLLHIQTEELPPVIAPAAVAELAGAK